MPQPRQNSLDSEQKPGHGQIPRSGREKFPYRQLVPPEISSVVMSDLISMPRCHDLPVKNHLPQTPCPRSINVSLYLTAPAL